LRDALDRFGRLRFDKAANQINHTTADGLVWSDVAAMLSACWQREKPGFTRSSKVV